MLESGEVVRLGSNETRKVDVRFVSATNKDLSRAAREGLFREDLFFRIKGAHIHLPPLRERREDIPRIARHAITRYATQMAPKGKPPVFPDISDAAMMRLTAYAWPGNVRQLLNVVQNMVVMVMGEAAQSGGSTTADAPLRIDTRHIPDEVSSPDMPDDDALAAAAGLGGEGGAAGPGLGVTGASGSGGSGSGSGGGGGSLAGTSLEQLEKRAIRETLRLTAGNREKAAQLLGIGERTLYRKLKEYGLR